MTQTHTGHGVPRARRIPVAPEPLIGGARYDYADAFEIELPAGTTSSPEQLFRTAVGRVPAALRWPVPIVHRHVLRFGLGPRASREHMLGWRILLSEPDVAHLEAAGPLIRGALVVRKVEPSRLVLTTFVCYVRRAPARVVWALVVPLHRRVASHLLGRVAATASQPDPSGR